jgi:hypothetical protein
VAGVLLLAACIAAVVLTTGSLRITAIVLLVLNVVSYVLAQPPVGLGGARRRALQIPTQVATAITVLTGALALGLLLYKFGFAGYSR